MNDSDLEAKQAAIRCLAAVKAVEARMEAEHPALWRSLLEGNPLPGAWKALKKECELVAAGLYYVAELPPDFEVCPLSVFSSSIYDAFVIQYHKETAETAYKRAAAQK